MATVYTTAGKAIIPDLIDGTNAVHLDATNGKIAWGTGAGTSDVGDTTLFVEASEARVAVVRSAPDSDGSVRGSSLTPKQRAFFGRIAGGARTIFDRGKKGKKKR